MLNRRSLALASIVAGRLLLAAVAAAAAVFGFASWQGAPAQTSDSQKSYACPMHPEVTSPAPGTCPICRMALEPKRASSSTAKAGTEPESLSLTTVSTELRAFDAVSRVKRFATSLEMRAPAWLESPQLGVALFPRDQSQLIQAGEAALFSPASRGDSPGITIHAADQPRERWDDATDLVRFRVSSGAELVAKEAGWVKFATRIRRDLVIRESAVRESTQGPYVLVASNDRHLLTKRAVEIGSKLHDYAAVISGLSEGEYVVAKHAFALDVERRFGSASP
jgi:hypothetical protein